MSFSSWYVVPTCQKVVFEKLQDFISGHTEDLWSQECLIEKGIYWFLNNILTIMFPFILILPFPRRCLWADYFSRTFDI